jgi:hypothetical protein
VEFTPHALERCTEYGRTPTDVGEAVLADHHRRAHNHGDADWKLSAGGTMVVYDWPVDDDPPLAGSVASIKR